VSRRTFRPALAFHVLTPLYDWATDLVGFGAPFVSRVADSLALRETESVLDVGCGTGTLLAELGHRYPRAAVAGIDADFRMLARARRKLVSAQVRATLVQAYAQHLPFSAGTFDAVVSTLIFHHLGTPLKQAALGEIHRVLKPGGRFLLADFGKPETALQWTVLSIGRLFDGIESTRANLQGRLPLMLSESGFRVAEIAPRYRGVQFLRATRAGGYNGERWPIHSPRM